MDRCIDRSAYMYMDMRIDMCTGMSAYMCVDVRIDTCIDMCIDMSAFMCMDTFLRHVDRHSPKCKCGAKLEIGPPFFLSSRIRLWPI